MVTLATTLDMVALLINQEGSGGGRVAGGSQSWWRSTLSSLCDSSLLWPVDLALFRNIITRSNKSRTEPHTCTDKWRFKLVRLTHGSPASRHLLGVCGWSVSFAPTMAPSKCRTYPACSHLNGTLHSFLCTVSPAVASILFTFMRPFCHWFARD